MLSKFMVGGLCPNFQKLALQTRCFKDFNILTKYYRKVFYTLIEAVSMIGNNKMTLV